MTAEPIREPLLTPRFFVMCGYTFMTFLSVFMLLPVAPFRILDLGGTKIAGGLFLGMLTYCSALSAPLTGAIADRIGKRRMLIICAASLVAFSIAYALTESYRVLPALAAVQGLFWSGLLSASSAYMTDVLPESRRAEGFAYWGLATVGAIAIAPGLGFAIYRLGWLALCASMGILQLVLMGIAFQLEETSVRARLFDEKLFSWKVIEWRVVVMSFTLFLYSFGYGGVTSFVTLYADENGVTPRGLYFTALAIVIATSRLLFGRFTDRVGHRRVFIPCLVLTCLGLALLAAGGTRPWLLASAVVFGLGFGSAQPVYVAMIMSRVSARRRGAAFGGILAAFDTGIGTGSIAIGWLAEHFGFATGFAVAAALAGLSVPYFLLIEKRFIRLDARETPEP